MGTEDIILIEGKKEKEEVVFSLKNNLYSDVCMSISTDISGSHYNIYLLAWILVNIFFKKKVKSN